MKVKTTQGRIAERKQSSDGAEALKREVPESAEAPMHAEVSKAAEGMKVWKPSEMSEVPESRENTEKKKRRGAGDGGAAEIDWLVTLVPLLLVVGLCGMFLAAPERSNHVLSALRSFLGDTFGVYYLALGLGIFLLSLYLAFSPIGHVVLGEPGEKPRFSFFSWGSMMFTAGLAADILFYSLCEWILYWQESYTAKLGRTEDWVGTLSLFHWGPTVWAFYLVLAVCFGFMLHVRKRSRQKYSEACRPLLGRRTDGIAGRAVDLLAVFALLAGTATTFSVATPLLSVAVRSLTGLVLPERQLTLLILIFTAILYTISVLRGMKGVSALASLCTYCFYGFLLYVLLFGGETRFILENGFASMGRLVQNFFTLSTYTDPLRETGFAVNWTVFYWAYWLVWCVAAPFFIGSISRGRTIRDTILGGYVFGLGSTLVSFLVLGNYGLSLQLHGRLDILKSYEESGAVYGTILEILKTLPLAPLVLLLLIITMIAFYATSFDSIALVAAQYSYRQLPEGKEPGQRMKAFWSVLLILLPLALVFSESSMANLQSVSIIAAFPIGMVILLIIVSFLKDVRQYLKGIEEPETIPSAEVFSEKRIEGEEKDGPSDEEIETIIENWEKNYGN